VALHKLRGMGFKEAVIVTDHGFFLNAQAEAGDVCVKPQGKWPVNAHDRMMLGDGTADGHSLVVSAEKVGIRGDFTKWPTAQHGAVSLRAPVFSRRCIPGGGRCAGAGGAPGYRLMRNCARWWWS
jgi:hypothetical protein